MATLTVEKINHLQSAATRNVNLMADEIALYGHVTPELWAMVSDEEDTQAAEILAVQEKAYAAIPRIYYPKGESLVDTHNQDLNQILDDGIAYMRQELEAGAPGADWELRRRQAERNNLKKIIEMPADMVCVEISASPFDKPKPEREAQHYTDLTMIRLSFKGQDNKVMQYNYALPVSSLQFLCAVQTKLGRDTEEQILDSEELLANPIIEKIDQSPEVAARQFDSLIGAALLEVSVGESAVLMIKKAIENRREAWEFVTSEANADIHRELFAAMQQAAKMHPLARSRAMDAIRSGFWKELKDRFNDKKIASQKGGILMAAASRAVVDGDVFIACGSTVVATEFAAHGSSAINRTEIVKNLRENVTGSGSCSACGARGKLFGCGLCGACNKKWCDEYERSGKQTNIKDLAYRNFARPSEQSSGHGPETFMQYWDRIGREIQQKREVKKLREAQIIRLKEEAELADTP